MAPVVCSDDNTMTDQKQLLFEASILHRIPPELFIQSSSSTRYLQSFPNGKSSRSWLWNRRKDRKEERLRKIARFHAELTNKVMARDTQSEDNRITGSLSNDKENSKENKHPAVDQDELLIDIALRTMVLMHHNQQLQNKLTALQIETRNFLRSSHNKRNQKRPAAATTAENETPAENE